MPKIIVDERDGEYIVDYWSGTDLRTWGMRYFVSVEDAPATLDVGDVYEGRIRYTDSNDDVETVEESVARRVRREYERFEDTVSTYAEEYGLDLDEPSEELEDGDVILVASPPEQSYPDIWEADTAYVFPRGIISDGGELGLGFSYLLNCAASTLESGMASDVLDLDEFVYGLRFDAERTRENQSKRIEVRLDLGYQWKPEGVESLADLVEPLHLEVTDFLDGSYGLNLYDSFDDSSGQHQGHRRIKEGGVVWSPHLLPMAWDESGADRFIPVDEVIAEESEHPDAPVAFLSRDADPIEVDRGE